MYECYGKKLLRIDLSTRSVTEEPLREPFIERWVGGIRTRRFGGYRGKWWRESVPRWLRSITAGPSGRRAMSQPG